MVSGQWFKDTGKSHEKSKLSRHKWCSIVNPNHHGVFKQVLKMYFFLAAHRNVETDWKLAEMVICIYR